MFRVNLLLTVLFLLELILCVTSLSVDTLSWNQFDHIPLKHACSRAPYNVSFPFGSNISPGIGFSRPPPNTKSMVLLIHDEETVPVFGFAMLHWGVIDIPATAEFIPEDATLTPHMPIGSSELQNDLIEDMFGIVGYMGPCPMKGGQNLYRVTLFARNVTNTVLPTTGDASQLIITLLSDGQTLAVAESMSIFP